MAKKKGSTGWGVWFGGRNTPIAVSASSRSEAITKARKKKKRGGNNVVSAKKLNSSQRKTASKGGWITTRASGKSTGGGKGCYGKNKKCK